MRYRVIEGKLVRVSEQDAPPLTTFSRRKFISGSFLAVGAAALTGCGLPGFGGGTTASGSRSGSRAGGGGYVGGGGWFGGGSSSGGSGGGGS
ncbi:MAG: hypothetical protein HYX32_10790 [Actinobacteria bacterium]|nr:hypothetical protein [Actinomycetota bacterium]